MANSDTRLVRTMRIGAELGAGDAHVYGLTSPTTGEPDLSTLTADLLPVRLEAAGLVTGGDMAMVGRTHQAPDYGMLADEADAPDGLLMRTGTIPMQTPLYSNPSPAGIFADLRSTPAALILSSGLVPRAAIAARTATVSGAPADDNTFTVADATGLEVGQLLALDKAGVRSCALIVGISGADVSTLTPFHTSLADADVVRVGQTWDLTAHGDLGPSVVAPMSFGDGRQVAYGCRADALVFQFAGGAATNGNAKVDLNATLKVGALLHDAGGTIADVINAFADEQKAQILTPSGRKSAETARTHPTISSVATQREDTAAAPPVKVAASMLQIDSMTATVNLGMEPTGRSDAAIGHADFKPGAPTVTVEMIVRTPVVTAAEVYAAVANYRAYTIPFGPQGAHGACICMPAARCVADPRLVEDGKTYHRYRLALELAGAHVESGGATAGFKVALF